MTPMLQQTAQSRRRLRTQLPMQAMLSRLQLQRLQMPRACQSQQSMQLWRGIDKRGTLAMRPSRLLLARAQIPAMLTWTWDEGEAVPACVLT